MKNIEIQRKKEKIMLNRANRNQDTERIKIIKSLEKFLKKDLKMTRHLFLDRYIDKHLDYPVEILVAKSKSVKGSSLPKYLTYLFASLVAIIFAYINNFFSISDPITLADWLFLLYIIAGIAIFLVFLSQLEDGLGPVHEVVILNTLIGY